MRIILNSRVHGHWRTVFNNFNEALFRHLLPPGAKLLRFDGSMPGNIVELDFSFPLKGKWISEITRQEERADHIFFIDEGRKLPFGLKSWRHIHTIKDDGDDNTIIQDDMSFTTGSTLLDILYYPFLFMAFLPRKIQYKTYFKTI